MTLISPLSSPPSATTSLPKRIVPLTRPVAWMISCEQRRQLAFEAAMDFGDIDAHAFPANEPFSAMRMRRLSIVASTRPSTTSVSQSRISAPPGLTSRPTIRRAAPNPSLAFSAPLASVVVVVGAAGTLGAGVSAGLACGALDLQSASGCRRRVPGWGRVARRVRFGQKGWFC